MHAQNDRKVLENRQDSVYCLVIKDGMSVLTSSSGRVITSDITLPDGTRISPKGVITRKDGTQIIMKDGECSNTIGKPMHEHR